MDHREYADWIAYWNLIGGWGPERDNVHAGILAAQIYACMGGKKSKWRLADSYMLVKKQQPKRRMTDDEIRAEMAAYRESRR